MADFQYLPTGSVTVNGYTFCHGASTTVPNGDWATIRKLRRHASFMETSSPTAATQGAQGEPGPQGPKGDKGDQGNAGATGSTGAASTVPGPTGSNGAAGAKGDKGDTGIQGPTGPTGPQGNAGSTGPAGPGGEQGESGPQGATGPAGAQGGVGATGSTGATGAQGIQGVKGDTGLTGSQGIQGNAGSQGIQGIQGIQGVAGVRTDTTVFGYTAGSGGAVTQLTSKATAVTLNNLTGDITLNAAALAAATVVTFVLTNSTIASTDQIICTHHATGTFGAYGINGRATGAGAGSIAVRNNSAGSLSEAIVIKYKVIR